MSKKIRCFLLGCALMVMCCMGITVGATDEADAEVVAHNLTITDSGINVNFYVGIQGAAEVTLNGSQVAVPAQPETIIIDAKEYSCYKFTQPVVAKKMDDTVSLKIVAGEKELVDEYSVNEYVKEVREDKGNGYNLQKLAEAMTFYGEFAEVYFDYNNKGISSDAGDYISGVTIEDVSKYKMNVETMPTGLIYKGTQLNLNSEVTLRLCFEEEEGSEVDVDYYDAFVAEYGNSQVNLELKKVGKYYCVDIEGIGADALDRGYTIKCGETQVLSNCSVLSYVRTVVKNYDGTGNKTELVNLSKALYLYNQMADTYVASQATAVYDIFYGSEGFSATPDEFTPVYLTGDGDVTTESAENTQVTTISQLNDSRTKGFSVWIQTAYTISANEALTGPYEFVVMQITQEIL